MTSKVPSAASEKRGVLPQRPSVVASQQGQIEDLVQRLRTSEHLCKRIQDDNKRLQDDNNKQREIFEVAVANAKDTANNTCDVLVACYKTIYLEAIAEIKAEHSQIIWERHLATTAHANVLAKERELVAKVLENHNFQDRIEELEAEEAQWRTSLQKAQHQYEVLHLQIQAKEREVSTAEKDRDDVESRIAAMNEEHAALKAQYEALKVKFERTELQLQGMRTKNTELEEENTTLRVAKNDLRQQLDKWERLETKGGQEAETLRQECKALEIENKELQSLIEKKDAIIAKREEKAAKLTGYVQKLRETNTQWEAASEDTEKQLNDEMITSEKLRRKVEKLRMRLREQAGQAVHDGTPDADSPKSSPEIVEIDADEDEPGPSKISRPAGGSKAVKDKEPKPPRSRSRKAAAAAEAEGQKSGSADEADDAEVAERRKRKGKAKAQSDAVTKDKIVSQDGASTGKQVDADDELVVVDPEPANMARGTKRTADDAGIDAAQPTSKPKPGGVAKQPSRQKPPSAATGRGRGKTASRAPSVALDDDDLGTREVPEKKKRKINIFSSSSTQALDFNIGSGTDTFGIPRDLSPVKEDRVPQRSMTSFLSRLR
ncbi:hypothetical protein FISHEDRAFT_51991 [Fistulina hepatica ATCC 64428]|nr:hypothetical protein FISHEDRAFT_51991 [Fistulina hepatica ATCC 64428]